MLKSFFLFIVFPFKKSNQEVNRVLWYFLADLQKSFSDLRYDIVNQILSDGSWLFVQYFLFLLRKFLKIELLFDLSFKLIFVLFLIIRLLVNVLVWILLCYSILTGFWCLLDLLFETQGSLPFDELTEDRTVLIINFNVLNVYFIVEKWSQRFIFVLLRVVHKSPGSMLLIPVGILGFFRRNSLQSFLDLLIRSFNNKNSVRQDLFINNPILPHKDPLRKLIGLDNIIQDISLI